MQCTMTPSIRYHKIPLWSNKDIRKTAHDNYTQSESVIKQILPLWVSCSQPAAAAQYISRESHFDTSSRVTKTWSTQAVSGRQKTAMHRHGSCIDYSLKFRQVTSTFIYTTTIQVTWLVVTEVRSESFGLVTERHHYNARPIYANCSSVWPVVFFIIEYGTAHSLCTCACYARIRHSTFGHHPYPLDAKFCFCCALHCGAIREEKLCTQSINH